MRYVPLSVLLAIAMPAFAADPVSAPAPLPPTAAAPALVAPAPIIEMVPGLVGAAVSRPGADGISDLLWEFPLDGPSWGYFSRLAEFGPAPGLLTPMSQTFSGYIEGSEGQWSLRISIPDVGNLVREACTVSAAIEGTIIFKSPLPPNVASAGGTFKLPAGNDLYELTGTVDCPHAKLNANHPIAITIQALRPGREIWEAAPVVRPARPVAIASAPIAGTSTGGEAIQTIRKRVGVTGPAWDEVIREFDIHSKQVSDPIAEISQTSPHILDLNNYPGGISPDHVSDYGMGSAKPVSHEATLQTVQRVSATGRWVYLLSVTQMKDAARIVRCIAGLSSEGKDIIANDEMAKYSSSPSLESIGASATGSFVAVGAANLSAGDYALTAKINCWQRLPQMKVWVKGPGDAAIRPLRPGEVGVKVIR